MRPIPVSLFAAAAASPLVLLALGIMLGGVWPLLALLYMTFAALTLDLLLPLATTASDDTEFPASDALLTALGLAALAALPLLTWAIAGPSDLGPVARAALFLAGGMWFGQVAHPAAHELIHRPPPLFGLGAAIYTALLFGHHASAHRLVHHRHVASHRDPNTARAGEGFYRFLIRAWGQSFRQGWRAETALRAGKPGLHPYAAYIGGALTALTLATLIAGLPGLLTWAALGLHAGFQILLSDYVQHYGLTRRMLANGKPEPVTIRHSWNTPHLFSAALMLNAPRHSDHHAHPSRAYPALRLPDDAPLLPWPLPVACAIALVPPLWRRRMRPELARRAALSKP
jgi:alkane 1-monooxygenase